MSWTLRLVLLNVLLSALILLLIILWKRDRTDEVIEKIDNSKEEVLTAVAAERRHFGNIESFWNAKWRAMKAELNELRHKARRFLHLP